VNYIADEPPEDANDKLKLVYPYKVPVHLNAVMRYVGRCAGRRGGACAQTNYSSHFAGVEAVCCLHICGMNVRCLFIICRAWFFNRRRLQAGFF
jgi:hypothetical protein